MDFDLTMGMENYTSFRTVMLNPDVRSRKWQKRDAIKRADMVCDSIRNWKDETTWFDAQEDTLFIICAPTDLFARYKDPTIGPKPDYVTGKPLQQYQKAAIFSKFRDLSVDLPHTLLILGSVRWVDMSDFTYFNSIPVCYNGELYEVHQLHNEYDTEGIDPGNPLKMPFQITTHKKLTTTKHDVHRVCASSQLTTAQRGVELMSTLYSLKTTPGQSLYEAHRRWKRDEGDWKMIVPDAMQTGCLTGISIGNLRIMVEFEEDFHYLSGLRSMAQYQPQDKGVDVHVVLSGHSRRKRQHQVSVSDAIEYCSVARSGGYLVQCHAADSATTTGTNGYQANGSSVSRVAQSLPSDDPLIELSRMSQLIEDPQFPTRSFDVGQDRRSFLNTGLLPIHMLTHQFLLEVPMRNQITIGSRTT